MIIIIALISVIVTVVSAPVMAGEFSLFPEQAKTISAETLPYSQMLHTGVENDTFYLRGRFGTDFHLAGYRFGDGKDVFFGISAAAHINMLPASGQRFPVDNFYALLALRFSGTASDKLSWRFYPIHHVSAHLADGHKGIDREAIRAVSTEMARGEVYYRPFGEIAEFGAGAGYHYHVCAQKELVYRADLSILLKPPSPYRVLGGELSPYALIRVENVRLGGDRVGAEASAGAALLRAGRGFGISIIYFDKPHSGYYFEKYEKGIGAEYMFLF